jgi:phospholipase C
MPTGYQSEHPDHLPAAGADFVASKIEAIASNVSDWRRAAFGDLMSAFRFSHARPRPPRLPDDTAERLRRAQEEVATLPEPTLPGADRPAFPRQDKGRRPHV